MDRYTRANIQLPGGGDIFSRKTAYTASMLVVLVVLGLIGAGVVSSTSSQQVSEQESPLPDRPNIVVIDVDRLTPFRMPCYGHTRNTTPVMCRIGAEGFLFENAISQAGWTAGGIASLFTGLYPSVHNVTDHQSSLSGSVTTVAEALTSDGYAAAAFPANKDPPHPAFLLPGYNLDQGFEVYGKQPFFRRNIPSAMGWIEDDTDGPFFVFIQGFEMHTFSYPAHLTGKPFPSIYRTAQEMVGGYRGLFTNKTVLNKVTAEKKSITNALRLHDGGIVLELSERSLNVSDEDIEYLKAYYDASARFIDTQVGRLITFLKERELYEDTIVIITSSHGESIASRKLPANLVFSHGRLYEGSIHVPLLVHVPVMEGRRVEEQVGLIDVMPTVFDISAINSSSFESQLQGRSFASILEGKDGGRRYVFSEGMFNSKTAVRTLSWKYIEASDTPGEDNALYRVRDGQTEDENVVESYPDVVNRLQQQIEAFHLANMHNKSVLFS